LLRSEDEKNKSGFPRLKGVPACPQLVGRTTGAVQLVSNSPQNPLAASINGGNGVFDLVIYQASGGQLFWLEVDSSGVFAGPLAKQGSLTGLP
jgi:hypothetical protein